MDIIFKLVLAIHVIVSLFLIITVLLQPGKGGDLGSVFGGTSESIFGASGAVPFLTKVTRFLAVIFMVTSLSLGYFSARGISSSVVEDSPPVPIEAPLERQKPVTPAEKQTESSSSEPGGSAETEAGRETVPAKDE